MTILYFLIALSILVAIHEWGHFIVAKLSGVGVETFSIGFGPKIASFRKGETEYRFSIIPLGGYVKLVGEDPMDDTRSQFPPEKWFSNKPVYARLATVLAGPVMNLVLALVLLPLVFVIGKKELKIFQNPPVVIDVLQDSPAAVAGMKPGDLIRSVDGNSVNNWEEVLGITALRPNQDIPMSIIREHTPLELTVQVTADPLSKVEMGFLGVEPHYIVGNEPVVGKVMAGMPAEKAGLLPGDRIVESGGMPVRFWSDVVKTVMTSQGKPTRMTVIRGEQSVSLDVAPIPGPESGSWVVGMIKQDVPLETMVHRYPVVAAAAKGWGEFKKLGALTWDVIERLFTLQLSYKSLGGPVQIAAASGAAAKSGVGEFLYFMAFLSLQLGILNLLPIPVLDGGHVAFMAIEAVIRREIPPVVKGFLIRAGMVLLLGLMLLVTLNDVENVWGLRFSKLFETIRGWF